MAGLYCDGNRRPGIDPGVAVQLMLAGFLLGIVHDRRLLREAQVNTAIRWLLDTVSMRPCRIIPR